MAVTIILRLIAAGGHNDSARVGIHCKRTIEVLDIVVARSHIRAPLDDCRARNIVAAALKGLTACQSNALQNVGGGEACTVHNRVVAGTVLGVGNTVIGPSAAGGLDLQRTLGQLGQTVLQRRIISSRHIRASILDGYHCRHVVDTRSNIVSDGAFHRHKNLVITIVQKDFIT